MVETEVADAAPAEEEVAQPADSSSQEGTEKNYDRRKSKPLKVLCFNEFLMKNGIDAFESMSRIVLSPIKSLS